MGCWGSGGQWGEVFERQAIRTLHAALDARVNLFATRGLLGQSQSEVLLGSAMTGRRGETHVAAKLGTCPQGDSARAEEHPRPIGCCHVRSRWRIRR